MISEKTLRNEIKIVREACYKASLYSGTFRAITLSAEQMQLREIEKMPEISIEILKPMIKEARKNAVGSCQGSGRLEALMITSRILTR